MNVRGDDSASSTSDRGVGNDPQSSKVPQSQTPAPSDFEFNRTLEAFANEQDCAQYLV